MSEIKFIVQKRYAFFNAITYLKIEWISELSLVAGLSHKIAKVFWSQKKIFCIRKCNQSPSIDNFENVDTGGLARIPG